MTREIGRFHYAHTQMNGEEFHVEFEGFFVVMRRDVFHAWHRQHLVDGCQARYAPDPTTPSGVLLVGDGAP